MVGVPTDPFFEHNKFHFYSASMEFTWMLSTGKSPATHTAQKTVSFHYSRFACATMGCEVIIPGCTDEKAVNFMVEATTDDGSCRYDEAPKEKPIVKVPIVP